MELCDPRGDFQNVRSDLRYQVDDLQGKVIGLLWNGYRNADEFLKQIELRLSAEHRIGRTIWYRKPYVTEAAPPSLLDQIASQCDVVFAAWGH